MTVCSLVVFYFAIWVKQPLQTDSRSPRMVLIDGKLRECGSTYTTLTGVHVNIFASCLKDMTRGNHTSAQSQVQRS